MTSHLRESGLTQLAGSCTAVAAVQLRRTRFNCVSPKEQIEKSGCPVINGKEPHHEGHKVLR